MIATADHAMRALGGNAAGALVVAIAAICVGFAFVLAELSERRRRRHAR